MATTQTASLSVLQDISTSILRAFPFRSSIHLTQQEAYLLMQHILNGRTDTDQLVEILRYLRQKGETVAELVGFASAMREMAQPVEFDQADSPILDTCGTGGDGASTFNISTAAALVIAGAGLRVAKHGNRRITSQCGSADVLEALGIPTTLSASKVFECVTEVGIGFLFAPLIHPAVRHAQEARLRISGRTVFNLLGPLTNPVRARAQLIGAYSVRAAEMIALASARMGVERAYVVHGSDGLDEITTTGLTTVFQVEDGRVQKGQWSPSDFGIETSEADELRGGDPESNADLIRRILDGELGPRRDIVVVNAAAALLIAGKEPDARSAAQAAAESIDSGAARAKLEHLVQFAMEHP